MEIMQTLNEYMNKVLDRNKDGKINFKDFLTLFPNNAVAIAVIFVDLLVAAAEYRVWDVGYVMTQDPLKAVGFVLVSAVPFYLGQIFWLNPLANGIQKWIAGGMVATALYTSWVFGTADLSQNYDVAMIVSMVTNMTAAYVVAVLVYVLSDNGIKANRMKREAEAAADQEKDFQMIARGVLRSLAETHRLQKETAEEFGDPALVEAQMNRLRGAKPEKPKAPAYTPPQQPARVYQQESNPMPELVTTKAEDKNPQPGRES